MPVLYVLAGNIAGIGLAALTLMQGGSLLWAFLGYWLACTVVVLLVALLRARFTGRPERDIGVRSRRATTQTPRRQEHGALRPVRSTD